MITTDAQAAAQDWISRALSQELPDKAATRIARLAEILTALAATEGVPIEVLIYWIHTRAPGKSWSGDEWRRFLAHYNRQTQAI